MFKLAGDDRVYTITSVGTRRIDFEPGLSMNHASGTRFDFSDPMPRRVRYDINAPAVFEKAQGQHFVYHAINVVAV